MAGRLTRVQSLTPRCGGTSPAASSTPACRRRSESAKPAAVEEGAFRDVAPVHDRRAELVIARVDFLGDIVACAGLGDNVFADWVQSPQHGVVKFQDFDASFLPQLPQRQR